MRACGGIVAVVLCVLAGAVPAGASQVFDLGSFVPTAISGSQAVGGGIVDPVDEGLPSHAGVWVNGTLTPLPEPMGTTASEVSGLNSDGRISGAVAFPGGVHAVYWDSPADPLSHQLGPLAVFPGDYSTTGGVDRAGRIVGTTIAADSRNTGFLATPGSGIVQVGTADRGTGSTSTAAVTPSGSRFLGTLGGTPNNGAADGWYLWPAPGAAGTKLDITPVLHGSFILGGAVTAQYANDLASDGTVLGYKDAATRTFWLRLPDGSETPVVGLVGHNAVNARHVVAGTIATTDSGGFTIPHAAIWKPDGTVIDLNTKLPPGSGLVLVDALAINDNGDVAGIATNGVSQVGFLLTAGYTVDDAGDAPDADVSDGACRTAGAVCTLRAAIEQSNAHAGPDAINFAIPGGTAVPVITPGSALPPVTGPVDIDGSSQPGAGRVMLDGKGGAGAGLVLKGGHDTVTNLAIGRFASDGLVVADGISTVLKGLWIGLGPEVTTAAPNGGDGVRISNASQTEVGGDVAASAMRIAGNGGAGVEVQSGRRNTLGSETLVYDNGGPGVDLGPKGKANPKGGMLAGQPNDALGAPVVWHILRAVGFGNLVAGVIPDAVPGGRYRLDVQSNACTPRALDKPVRIASKTITATAGGVAAFQVAGPAPGETANVRATLLDDAGAALETSEVSACAHDADSDEIVDEWETARADPFRTGTASLDLAAMGASPKHKDLFLQLAWSPGEEIDPAATKRIEQAFADAPITNVDGRKGINLHIDDGPTSVMNLPTGKRWGSLSRATSTAGEPHGPVVPLADWTRFAKIRERVFPVTRSPVFRFAFSDRYVMESDKNTLGEAHRIPSSEFALGLKGDCKAEPCPVTLDRQTGAIMHEFGHTLGLRHGGVDDYREKPNHLSIMNYLFTEIGLAKTTDGRTFTPGLFDYSRFDDRALPDLDQRRLKEAAGLAPKLPALYNFGTLKRCPPVGDAPPAYEVQWLRKQVDWNCNDKIDPGTVSVTLADDLVKTNVSRSFAEWDLLEYTAGEMLAPTSAPASISSTRPRAIAARAGRAHAAAQAAEAWPSAKRMLAYARALTGDRAAPALTLVLRRAGTAARPRLKITVSARDARALDSVTIVVDRRPALVLRAARRGKALKRSVTVEVKAGRHTVRARAVDAIGQPSSVARGTLTIAKRR